MIISYVMFAIVFLVGLLQFLTGNTFTISKARFTEESIKAYARPAGVWIMLMALSAAGFIYFFGEMLHDNASGWLVLALLVLFVVFIIGTLRCSKKYLVKQ